MRGVGGPLLSIGDLLADLGEETGDSPENNPNPDNSSKSDSNDAISGPLDLTRLFQVTLLIQKFALSFIDSMVFDRFCAMNLYPWSFIIVNCAIIQNLRFVIKFYINALIRCLFKFYASLCLIWSFLS